MLIYIILLVVVIGVVGFVLKKRKDDQAAQNNSATARSKATGSSGKSAPSKTKVVEESIAVKKEATPLTPALRKNIESLIHEHNFFAAEAQINQALKKDNTQHELYLLLLDLHILQKDEFAISQLINHIQSLGLDDIIVQAEAKKAEFEKSLNAVKDTIDFQPASTHSAETPSATVDNSAAFEELSPTRTTDNDAFDQLQQNTQTKPVEETPLETTAPLDFNFEPSFDQVQSKPIEESAPTPAVETKTTEETAPLDFNFSVEPTSKETTLRSEEKHVEGTAPLDFNFSIEPTSKETTLQVEEKPVPEPEAKLDFSFATAEPAAEQKSESTDSAPSLDFDFAVAPTEKTEIVKPVTQEPNLDFDLTASKPTSANLETEKVAAPAPIDLNDPLVQAFAELTEVNEVTLNLDLAAQYIQLGAYQAARDLLDEKQADYSAEQQQVADELRKQIA